jgi:hypothetical protein
MSFFDISSVPVKITGFDPECIVGRVDLSVGNYAAAIIEPRKALLSCGLVYLCESKGVDWEQLIENGCTNDPRIVEIATKLIRGKLSERDVGTVYPPLDKAG